MWENMTNTIQNRIDEAISKFSSRTAVEYKDRWVTYEQLGKEACKVANILLKYREQRDAFIGVLTRNKLNLIYSVLGVWKAGMVFVPLDSSYPVQRIHSMLEISKMEIILTDNSVDCKLLEAITENNSDVKIINIDSEYLGMVVNDTFDTSIIEYKPEDKIYLYFTSGSSGKPKAVLGKNTSLLQFIAWEIKTFHVDENTRVSQFTSQCHDPFLRDVFVPLLAGGTLCIPENKEQLLSGVSLINWIESKRLNLIHCTPSLFRVFNSKTLSAENFNDLKYILLAGERILPGELANWYQIFGSRIQLVNLYGPTETTLAKLFYYIQPSDINRNSIPIGSPIEGCKIMIVDEDMKLKDKGERGEIIIRTPYHSFGYFGDVERTREKFIQNPFYQEAEDILYKTGDLGRILSDGNVEFLGRVDRQVKIRGFRVELDEIENELIKYPGIKECVLDFGENISKIEDKLNVSKCKKCGIPSIYPGTILDEKGICNVCHFYEEHKEKVQDYFGEMEELEAIIKDGRGNDAKQYDCMLLYSGGKDSTYVLYKLVEMGFKVLAYTFDNGFISETAIENIKNIVKELNVDHVFDSYNKMNEIFLNGLHEECSVCNGCFKVLRIKSTKFAYEKGIKNIVTGFSRGQIFDLRLSDILKQGIFNVDEIEKKIFEQRLLYHIKNDYVTSFMSKDMLIDENMLKEIRLIDFYRYTNASKREIFDFLKSTSEYWNNPADTGVCSSNCKINDVGVFVQRKERGYDNYTYPNSWEVRTEHISLEDADNEYDAYIDTLKVERIMAELGYRENEENHLYSDIYIAAYYTSEGIVKEDEIREYLEKRLPDYMIPSYFIHIENIPLHANGKVNYKSLPNPKRMEKVNYIPPRDWVEEELEKIWCELLDLERVGIDQDFLKIGGHSLKVMNLVSLIYQKFEIEMHLNDVFNRLTIQGLAEYIRNTSKGTYISIPKARKKEFYSVSEQQKVVYSYSQIKAKNIETIFNNPSAVLVEGSVDIERFNHSLKKLVRRHETLRTTFELSNGNLVQKIHDDVPDFKLNYYNFEGRNPDEVIRELTQPFNLEKPPMLRVDLAKLSKSQHLLLFDMSRIIADGTSVNIVIRDCLELYSNNLIPELKIQYKDYIEWFNIGFEEKIKKMEKYWMNKYKEPVPDLNFPIDFRRSWIQSFKGTSIYFTIDTKTRDDLYNIAKSNDVTLYMVLLAALYVLLNKYTGQEDIVIGSPVAARPHTDLKNVVGQFANVMPIRNKPSVNKTFINFLNEVKIETLDAYENQYYPFARLAQKIGISKQIGRNAFFDVMLILQNVDRAPIEIDGLKFTHHNLLKNSTEYDITLDVMERDNEIRIRLEYGTKLFKSETMERFARNYVKVLTTITQDVNVSIESIGKNLSL